MTDDEDLKFHLVDTKVGKRAAFDTLEQARGALQAWITLQRGAGEAVFEQPGGQWTDSRLTTWIAGPDQKIIRLND